MVAPNRMYPMFIVAPSQRRNRVREQLVRPSFRHLGLSDKVRYLPLREGFGSRRIFWRRKQGIERRRDQGEVGDISALNPTPLRRFLPPDR